MDDTKFGKCFFEKAVVFPRGHIIFFLVAGHVILFLNTLPIKKFTQHRELHIPLGL